MHLLIVDNDATATYVFERHFKNQGYTVSVAHTSETAFVLSQTEPIDLIVSDFRMPDMNGLELIRLMRKKKENLPALLWTGFIEHETLKNNQLGVEVVAKSNGLPVLLRRVEELLGAA
jgi:two-component system response regulator HydG